VYRSGDYPCTVQLTFNNSEDTSFSINKNSVGTYNITWNSGSSTRYLGRINSETYWLTTTDNTYTQWIFEPVYYNQNNLKKELYMPVNINQRYFDSLSGKCAGVCAMDISNYYRGKDYPQFNEDDNTSLDDEVKKEVKAMLEIGMFTGNALNWGAVPGVAFMNTYKDGSVSAEEIYALAVDSINNGYPIMIHYYDEPVYNPNGNTHWVIPVAYDENNPGLENITVCDPTTRNVTYAVNKTWSLSDSFDYNMKKENDSTPYYYGFVLTYPKKENTN